MVNSYTGPLGSEYGTGIPDRLCVCVRATPKVSSELFLLLLEKNQSDPQGFNKTLSETGHSTAGTSCGGRVLVQHIPSLQGGWRTETSDNPQNPQPICQHQAFQNGRYSHHERSPETRGLASHSRLERHILCHSHTPNPQKVPQFPNPREHVPLCMSKGYVYQLVL